MRRKLASARGASAKLDVWLERAERIHRQRPHDKNKLYALHAPEVECIGKGKARKPYEFGVKVSLAVTHKQARPEVGARTFPSNFCDGHTPAAQLEQTGILLQDIGVRPTTAVVDLGFRRVDDEVAPVHVIHRGKNKSLTTTAASMAQAPPGDRAGHRLVRADALAPAVPLPDPPRHAKPHLYVAYKAGA